MRWFVHATPPSRLRSAAFTAVGVGLSLSVPLLSLEMERMGRVGHSEIGANTAIAGIAAIMNGALRAAYCPGANRRAAPALGRGDPFRAVPRRLQAHLRQIVIWFPLRFVFSMALGGALRAVGILDQTPPPRRGDAASVMGIYATVLALGFAAGPAVLALVGTQGWAPYLAGAGLCLVAALPLLLARGISPRIDHGKPGRTVLSFLLAAPAATVAALIFGAVESGGFAILPLYGLELGYTAANAAFLASIMALGNVPVPDPDRNPFGSCRSPSGACRHRHDRPVRCAGHAAGRA